MSDLLFNNSLSEELDRFQRQISSLFTGQPSSIRASRLSSFPQINLGSTDESVEIVAFGPGIDPAKLELTVDKGLLSISGERTRVEPQSEGRSYTQERFVGAFRRAIELPRDADSDNVKARYERLPDDQYRQARDVAPAHYRNPIINLSHHSRRAS